jgi:predicted nucleotidyltransferase
MNSGLTKSRIKNELAHSLKGISEVEAVFGFGSYFRDEPFDDVDLAVVFTDACENSLAVYELLVSRLRAADIRLGVHFHVTPFTGKEFKQKPLREHNTLIRLFSSLDRK